MFYLQAIERRVVGAGAGVVLGPGLAGNEVDERVNVIT